MFNSINTRMKCKINYIMLHYCVLSATLSCHNPITFSFCDFLRSRGPVPGSRSILGWREEKRVGIIIILIDDTEYGNTMHNVRINNYPYIQFIIILWNAIHCNRLRFSLVIFHLVYIYKIIHPRYIYT